MRALDPNHVPTYTAHAEPPRPMKRPRKSYTVSCSCGWSASVNCTKRDAEKYHTAHIQDARRRPQSWGVDGEKPSRMDARNI